MKNLSPLETDEQKALVQYCQVKKLFFFSVPNGSVLKGNAMQRARQMSKLKSEGLVVGTSDFVVMLPNHILFIELKRQKGSTTSKAQKDFLEKVNNFGYAKGKVCKGVKEAIEFIEDNLNI